MGSEMCIRDRLDSTPMDYLDFASTREGLAGKMGIDATTKLPGEYGYQRQWPELVTMSAEVKADVDAKWAALLAQLGGSAR